MLTGKEVIVMLVQKGTMKGSQCLPVLVRERSLPRLGRHLPLVNGHTFLLDRHKLRLQTLDFDLELFARYGTRR